MKFLLPLILLLTACPKSFEEEKRDKSSSICKDEGVDIGAGGRQDYTCPHPNHRVSITEKGYLLCKCEERDR